MKHTARVLAACLVAISAAVAAWAIEWPTDKVKAPLTFGSISRGGLGAGIVAATSDGLARSGFEGELFFVLDHGKLADGLPSGIGSFEAVEGKDGLVGIYAGLADGSASGYLRQIKAGDILGRVDPQEPGLFFSLYDRVKRRFVNPFVFLSPPADKRDPSIRAAALVSGTQQVFPLGETRSVRQGTYELIAEVSDPDEGTGIPGSLRAPYSVNVFIDGVERLHYVYETAKGDKGRLVFFGQDTCSRDYVRSDDRVRLGSYLFNRGKASILIVVKDLSGNERESGFTVLVE